MKNLNITINFDMDGTIADLYGVENWLDYLIAGDVFPYENAEPLLRLSALAHRLNNLQKNGYNLAIISWLSKSGTDEYNAEVEAVKRKWLAKHLPSVKWDAIHIVPYGTPKQDFCGNPLDILFDADGEICCEINGKQFDCSSVKEFYELVEFFGDETFEE